MKYFGILFIFVLFFTEQISDSKFSVYSPRMSPLKDKLVRAISTVTVGYYHLSLVVTTTQVCFPIVFVFEIKLNATE